MYSSDDEWFNFFYEQAQLLTDVEAWIGNFMSHLYRPNHGWWQVCECKQAKKLRKRLKNAGVV